MSDFLPFCLLLAQDDGPSGFLPLPVMIVIFVALFYFMLIRPEKQKQKTHQTLLEGIKKNDRVVTVGGMYGVVTNVQRDKDEITVRVDESTGTKILFTFSAISRVVTDDADDKSGK